MATQPCRTGINVLVLKIDIEIHASNCHGSATFLLASQASTPLPGIRRRHGFDLSGGCRYRDRITSEPLRDRNFFRF